MIKKTLSHSLSYLITPFSRAECKFTLCTFEIQERPRIKKRRGFVCVVWESVQKNKTKQKKEKRKEGRRRKERVFFSSLNSSLSLSLSLSLPPLLFSLFLSLQE
jgi:hypothetical protein